MREILFRGKRPDNGEWSEGCLLKVTIDGKTAHLIFGDNFSLVGGDVKALSHALVDPATVGQFTGLTDKNGKKIFEGDILAMKGMEKLIIEGVVRYGTFNCTCCHGVYGWFVDGGDIRDAAYMCEVIGNIHDNPELLEVLECH